MRSALFSLCAAVVLCSAAAAPWRSQLPLRRTLEALTADAPTYNQTEHRFEGQRLDHFSTADRRTWDQRYFVIDDYWKAPDGPVILHICGEYTCPGINPERLFPLEMAEKYNALVVSLEHRYFGDSQPFRTGDGGPDLTVENLRFLSSRQAINDLAWFSEWFQEEHINKPYGHEGRNTWTVVAGSYPGALASWYRLKFPWMSTGSHSSSGVVLAVLNYTAFDEQVARSAGDECADALRKATREAEESLPGCKALFNATDLLDGDFFYLMADSAAEAVQYGHKDIVCDAVVPTYKEGKPVLDAFAKYTRDYFYDQMGNSPDDYNSRITADPVRGGNGRSWRWMTCSELAYWQQAPAEGSIRSQQLNFTYFTDYCARVFDLHELPDVVGTNNYYGGNRTAHANTWYDQGGQDPWQWAGVRESLGPEDEAVVVDCDGCAHCCTLYTPAESDPQPLKDARDKLRAQYAKWMQGA